MRPLALSAVFLAGSMLSAQTPHFGASLNLNIPMGEFASHTLAPTADFGLPQKVTYDVGLGGQFTASFPVDPKLAFRLEVFGQSESGRQHADGYSDLNLRHQIIGVGAEMQIFLGDGNANRYRGLYLVAGISADFERFDTTYEYRDYGYWYTDTVDSNSKSRMGLLVGVGHAFGYGGGPRFTMEAVYHKSLTGTSTSAGDPPSTDFLRLGFGFMF
jgi:hypothetical protein